MKDIKQALTESQKITDNIKEVIVGKDQCVELAIIALMSQGHVLIEDVPGVGKTMLARSLARSSGCEFKRIQFTPDLLPSDVTGVSIYNQKSDKFEFKPGPIVSQIVLADEINRATPKTQSSMLEAMEEHQVTVEGTTYELPRPFTVMATQNPIEYEGTFPLPEAQLDRFLLTITIGYPSPTEELDIVNNQQVSHPIETLKDVTTPNNIEGIQEQVKKVYVDDLIRQYIVTITQATRNHDDISLGSSPRGSLALFRCSQAMAMLRGRDFVLPDDVKELAKPVLSHRVVLATKARMRGIQSQSVINEIIDSTPIPGAQAKGWVKP